MPCPATWGEEQVRVQSETVSESNETRPCGSATAKSPARYCSRARNHYRHDPFPLPRSRCLCKLQSSCRCQEFAHDLPLLVPRDFPSFQEKPHHRSCQANNCLDTFQTLALSSEYDRARRAQAQICISARPKTAAVTKRASVQQDAVLSLYFLQSRQIESRNLKPPIPARAWTRSNTQIRVSTRKYQEEGLGLTRPPLPALLPPHLILVKLSWRLVSPSLPLSVDRFGPAYKWDPCFRVSMRT
jgi:hypothetical protein